ncbi:NADPH:quinone reductase [Rugosimonospora africana]|uniref:Oxidoreductase n=1 Tax=Rugosimonospora africana TaxID=556532 RepID=A0A8J3VPU2_9ACTN|nr:NADPH:quinone reductase [Rugosimonospora africana]GIH13663.1 oxidoreductase [Rugosimonospora africana]
MRAAYIERLGPVDEIRYGELPDPRPGPADVLVRVAATTVNAVDTFIRSGAWRTPVQFPFVIARDLVGTVVETGADVTGFRPGDPVWCNSLGHAGRQGAAAELAVVPVDRLYHLPAGVSAEDAVTVFHPAGTAYLALFTHGRLQAGQTVVVIGAGGNVGGAAILFAVEAGARVIAVASDRDADYCRSLGAAEFVDYRDPDWTGAIRRAAPDGVDLYLDSAGKNELADALDLLAWRGRVVVVAGMATRPVVPAASLYLKDATVTGFVISRATVTELAEAADAINRLLAAGSLHSRAVDLLPLSEAAESHRRQEAGELHGRRIAVQIGTVGS